MTKPKYSLEFKKEAVKLITEQGYSIAQVSENLDVSTRNLYNWKNDKKISGISKSSEQNKELAKLRKEVAQLKMEREILKKAAAFFARDLN